MQKSQSMKSLTTMQPEEAKVAASLLRLTSSEDEIDQPGEKCDYDTYIGKHCQFPYHTAVQKKSEPVVSFNLNNKNSQDLDMDNNDQDDQDTEISEIPPRKRTLQRRCNSTPVSEPAVVKKPAITKAKSFPLSQSAPASGSSGFFQRFVPNFIRRRLSRTDNQEISCGRQEGKEESGQFTQQFNLMTTNMDSLLFMSLR